MARRRGLDLYLDGARLMNAVVASGVPARDFAEGATLVSLCFSKGLGAPVGSILAGDRDRIREARRLRKRLGGAMRQAGVLAAAAIHALENNVARLAEDHDNARALAVALAALPGVQILHLVETNMVFASFAGRERGRAGGAVPGGRRAREPGGFPAGHRPLRHPPRRVARRRPRRRRGGVAQAAAR